VVGVGLREDATAVRSFARELGLRFPLWVDAEGRSARAFGVWGHPNTILIDRAGRVIAINHAALIKVGGLNVGLRTKPAHDLLVQLRLAPKPAADVRGR